MDRIGKGVVTVSRVIDAPPEAVWDVLADGWFYATWVVGASRVRDVDRTWPASGRGSTTRSGVWPAVISDTTPRDRQPEPDHAELVARGWPAGEAEVVIAVTPRRATGRTVEIAEDAVVGPGHARAASRCAQLAIGPRNVEALRRLAYLAEGRHRERRTSATRSVPQQAVPRGPGAGPRRAAPVRRPLAPSAARAAFHPQAPCTPPPGWAEALAR